MQMDGPLVSPTDLYRLPWSLTENVLAWLEPTKRCNLYCEGCYSRNEPGSDKSLEQVRRDLDAITSQRTVDSISIAGGDPLVYPHIVETVRIIREEYGLKPVINTNGLGLSDRMLHELKDAGLTGFTFHVDSSQERPDWKDRNELELNELRLELARRVAEAGGMSIAFNATIFPHTLKYVPELVQWASDHIDIVHSMVFILFRTMRTDEYRFFADGNEVDMESVVYFDQDRNPEPLTAEQVVATIREKHPDFQPSAYLGGTRDPNSMKWLLTGRVGSPSIIEGYVGPRYMELIQTTHHMLTGRYLAYVEPSMLARGRSMMMGLSPLDPTLRKTTGAYLKKLLRNPFHAARKQYMQTILIIQPIDFGPDGELNMCDGCPDMTVHEGKLVWSCRLDEYKEYGCFLSAVPRAGKPDSTSPPKPPKAKQTRARKRRKRATV